MDFMCWTVFQGAHLEEPAWGYVTSRDRDGSGTARWLCGHKPTQSGDINLAPDAAMGHAVRATYTEETVPEEVWAAYCTLRLQGEI